MTDRRQFLGAFVGIVGLTGCSGNRPTSDSNDPTDETTDGVGTTTSSTSTKTTSDGTPSLDEIQMTQEPGSSGFLRNHFAVLLSGPSFTSEYRRQIPEEKSSVVKKVNPEEKIGYLHHIHDQNLNEEGDILEQFIYYDSDTAFSKSIRYGEEKTQTTTELGFKEIFGITDEWGIYPRLVQRFGYTQKRVVTKNSITAVEYRVSFEGETEELGTMTVTPDGRILDFSVETGTSDSPILRSYTLSKLGKTTVERPNWAK